MKKQPDTIPKQPILTPAEDFYHLRREGIGFIAEMGSRLWTDYNTHDPGITILESFCYAITDLAYRTKWDIKDILAPEVRSLDLTEPYPNQAFFTAQEILTVNPCTVEDFRRLLIDLDGVRNAWIFGNLYASDLTIYAWCDDSDQFILDYKKPNIPEEEISKIQPQGLYDILLELEADNARGDLNDRKIIQTYPIFDVDTSTPHLLTLELRFPLLDQKSIDDLTNRQNVIKSIEMLRFAQDKLADTLIVDEDHLIKGWYGVFYTSLKITLVGKTSPTDEARCITMQNATLRLFGDEIIMRMLRVKEESTQYSIQKYLQDITTSGFIESYREKLMLAKDQIDKAIKLLHSHRNLNEDYRSIKVVSVEDVAVCADVEVTADADIERIQARVWFEIEKYFNPPIPFYSLKELENAEVPVPTEIIFSGPKLKNGFFKAEELKAARLRTVLLTSDIINRLIDIKDEGVVSINYLSLTKYDEEGNPVTGHADPDEKTGKLDPNKTSASWRLNLSPFHQPRFNLNLSRFLFIKNGLPFLPKMDEALNILTQLRGEAELPRIKNTSNNLPIPTGTFRKPEEYYPLQYNFPLNYGIGKEGLPLHASIKRKGQAKQLKAFLMIFEQLMGNALTQLAHTADLFSLDSTIEHTYFVKEFNETVIQGYKDLIEGLDRAALESMIEKKYEFYERRNRFLNHLMARFGEQFGEYTVLLNNLQGQQVALDRLIDNKISFLKTYPIISRDKNKAFDYKDEEHLYSLENISGLKKRINLLLGHPELAFYWNVTNSSSEQCIPLQLKDRKSQLWLEINSPQKLIKALNAFVKAMEQKGDLEAYEIVYEDGELKVNAKDKNCSILEPSKDEIRNLKNELVRAIRIIIVQMMQPNALTIIETKDKQFLLSLKGSEVCNLEECQALIKTKIEAQTQLKRLIDWCANERAIVVEHLLLRPRFLGDALYPGGAKGTCFICKDEDPYYSFRLTFVMPGWIEPYNTNLDVRKFVERTIREETPSHIYCQIFWVGNDNVSVSMQKDPAITDSNKGQFDRFEDAWFNWLGANSQIDWIKERLQEHVEAILLTHLAANFSSLELQRNEIRNCAAGILIKYGNSFHNQLETHFMSGKALKDFILVEPDVKLSNNIYKEETANKIISLLKERYVNYKGVSYRLGILLDQFSKLRNTYPYATLHDCEDGNDQNPVRLDSTALGPLHPPP